MNNRVVALRHAISRFRDNPDKSYYKGFIINELKKYKKCISKKEYSPIQTFISLCNNSSFTTKHTNKMRKLFPHIIEIINNVILPEDDYTDKSSDSESSEYVVEDVESSIEKWDQSYIDQIKHLKIELTHKNKMINILEQTIANNKEIIKLLKQRS